MFTKFYQNNVERIVIDGVVDFEDYYSGRMSHRLGLAHR